MNLNDDNSPKMKHQILEINGKWTGTLVYGKIYGPDAGKELHFEMEIAQENDQISGMAIDVRGEGASPDSATINGQVGPSEIKFVKQYASLHYMQGGKMVIDRSQKGPLIHYTGTFDEATGTFSGIWKMRMAIKLFFWKIPLPFHADGTWKIARKAA
jgi:hypothetical protein